MKLLLQGNIASHYRTPIYKLIDQELGCDYCFGDKWEDIKKLDYSSLQGNVTEVKNIFFPHGYYQKGFLNFLRRDYDTYIICAETRNISSWLFLIFRKLFYPHKRVFSWNHGMLGKEGVIKQFLYKLQYRLLTGAFIYNERSVRIMVSRGIPEKKLHTIYNSLNYDRQLIIRQSLKQTGLFFDYFGNDNKNIVFIGRLTKVKRFELLLEAVGKLKEQGLFVNITFIGDGEERESMEKRIEDLGIKEQVWFHGACYNEFRNAELLYNADLCVSPGNIGLTAIHSLMFGCPAITNDDFNHQMPEFETIKEGVTGTFFKAYESESLASSIRTWFSHHLDDRDEVRNACYHEIDTKWNPHNQIDIFTKVLLGQ